MIDDLTEEEQIEWHIALEIGKQAVKSGFYGDLTWMSVKDIVLALRKEGFIIRKGEDETK